MSHTFSSPPTSSIGKILDSPLTLAPELNLRNRVVLASLTRDRAGSKPTGSYEDNDGTQADAVPNAYLVEHYRQRARGGFGLLLSEGAIIEPIGTEWPNAPGIWSEEQIEGWKVITETVHKENCLIFCQLWHTGRVGHPDMKMQKAAGFPLRAPSSIAARGGKFRYVEGSPPNGTPEALEDPKIIVELYRQAAKNAKEAGFDGVEFHSANGYLPNQFLDKFSNQRTDKYGGSAENRIRFPLECLDAILSVFPSDRVGIKLSPSGGFNDVGMDEKDTVETYGLYLSHLAKLSLSYVQFLVPLPHMSVELPGDGPEPKGEGRSLCAELDVWGLLAEPFKKELKKVAGQEERSTKIFWNGGLGGKATGSGKGGAEMIKDGKVDALVFGTDSITNPDLPYKLFFDVPLYQPGGGAMKPWYVDGEAGLGDGYINHPLCDAFLSEVGFGEPAVTVGA